MNRFEKRKKAIEQSMLDHVEAYKAIYKKSEEENRDPSDDERLEIEEHHRAIGTLKEEREGVEANIETLKGVEDIGREIGASESLVSPRVTLDREDNMIRGFEKSLGEMFVESDQFQSLQKSIQSSGRLSEGMSTGPVMMTKGTMLEGSQVTPGTGGPLAAPVPQVVGGVVETLFQKLTFADLILSGAASGNGIRYVVEGTALSGAAGVAEAGLKPESTLALSMRDEPVKKIATILPIAEEMLEDAPFVQSYINGRLSLFVQIEEERQLFRGTSGGNEVQGILTSRNVPVYAGGTAAGNTAEQLFKAINGLRGSAFIEPDWIVMHPTDWQALRLLKDTANQYYGGGPFMGPYGNGSDIGASSQVTGALDQVWNKPVYVTAGIGNAGTALVGTSSAAQVWRRGGVSVEATNSHSDYFQRNLVAIRAEERLALAVYRPGAFVQVNLA